MRRLLVVLIALGMLFALPASAATAHDERFVISVHVSETQTGVARDGALLAEGTFDIAIDGTTVETGVERSRYYVSETAARGSRTYRDDSTGNVVVTTIKASLIDADEVNGIFVYTTKERIVSSTDGTMGHGVGTAVVTFQPDGSFVLESWTDFILNA